MIVVSIHVMELPCAGTALEMNEYELSPALPVEYLVANHCNQAAQGLKIDPASGSFQTPTEGHPHYKLG